MFVARVLHVLAKINRGIQLLRNLLLYSPRRACYQILKVWITRDVGVSELTRVVADDFPSIPDILADYPRKDARGETSHSNAPLPDFLRRSSIRATTYDGKPLFMKRKTRIAGLQTVSKPSTPPSSSSFPGQ